MQRFGLLVTAVLLTGVAACNGVAVSGQEIVLPEGNAERGEEAFVELQCTACHFIRDRDLPAAEELGTVTIALGGSVSKVKTHGDLVTSIINPSHKLARDPFRQEIAEDGQSVMPIYNDVMTVTQLIDIVTFLESQYEVMERPGYRYPVYRY